MDAKTERAITQTTGARVELGNSAGTVTGHYDDDIVYVTFDGEFCAHSRVHTSAHALVARAGPSSSWLVFIRLGSPTAS